MRQKLNIPGALTLTIKEIYERVPWEIARIEIEKESKEYEACRFSLAGKQVVFRSGKITPTKVGQFVTLWKRPHPGSKPAPLSAEDGIDFVVVNVSDGSQHGQFVFNRSILIDKGILAGAKRGKTAFRIYPSWSKPTAKDAIATQNWQLRYFFRIDGKIDFEKVKRLFTSSDEAY